MSTSLKQTFGFLGAGRMASALAGGMVQAGLVKGRQLIAGDVVPAAVEAFTRSTGGRAAKSNAEVLRKADVVVLAVKPHQVTQLLAELADQVTAKHRFDPDGLLNPGKLRGWLESISSPGCPGLPHPSRD